MQPDMRPLTDLIPGVIHDALNLYLWPDEAAYEIRRSRGIIPIAIIPSDEYKVVWFDTKDYQFTDWKFRYSIENIATEHNPHRAFTTDLQFLVSDDATIGGLYPTGFIFQMSRCGSTLLAKALARSPRHMVLNEGTPLHENLWQYLTGNWRQPVQITDRNLALIRNLILAMGRCRTPEQYAYFVKFRSWNVLFIDIIMKAFPDVPCLFMYRDPSEIFVSALEKDPTGYSRLKVSPAGAFLTGFSVDALEKMSRMDYFNILYELYFQSVLKSPYVNINYLNYALLNQNSFPKILKHAFHYTSNSNEISQMRCQFNYYSKDDIDGTLFVSDKKRKQYIVTNEIRDAVKQKLTGFYSQMEESKINLSRDL